MRFNADGMTWTFNATALNGMKSFTLPEITAEVSKDAALDDTVMTVEVSTKKDLGQTTLTYLFDHTDTAQNSIRAGVGNTVQTLVGTFANGDTVTIVGKISSVGGAGSDGLGNMVEAVIIENTVAPAYVDVP